MLYVRALFLTVMMPQPSGRGFLVFCPLSSLPQSKTLRFSGMGTILPLFDLAVRDPVSGDSAFPASNLQGTAPIVFP